MSPAANTQSIANHQRTAGADRAQVVVKGAMMAIRLSRKTFRECASQFEKQAFSEVLAETARDGYPPSHCGRCLAGVSDSLVRVDKENFVSTNRIEFDVSAIDDALSLIVGKRAIPTAALMSRDLGILPPLTEYNWNPCATESTCFVVGAIKAIDL